MNAVVDPKSSSKPSVGEVGRLYESSAFRLVCFVSALQFDELISRFKVYFYLSLIHFF